VAERPNSPPLDPKQNVRVGGGHASLAPLAVPNQGEVPAGANSLAGHGVDAVNDSHTYFQAEARSKTIDALRDLANK